MVYSGAAILHVSPPVIVTSAGDISNSCTANITIPIGMGNCNNVGAISLTLNYDPGVLVLLRQTSGAASTATAGKRIARQAGFILKNGDIVATDGSGLLHFNVNITQNLFAIVWHRNHLGIMSANPLIESGGVYTYDFTTPLGQAYGTGAQKNLGGVYGMFAGDADANGDINNDDIIIKWTGEAGNSGYIQSDMNLNGQGDNLDKNDYWIENKGKQTQIPN